MKSRINEYREVPAYYLTADELYSIEKLLNRKPTDFELHMFAAMWSEHISYKSSTKWVEELPVKGERVIVQARDENAGVIELDDEFACVVKMESHNHPTAVNSLEAGVGVGNVYRDLMSMGAMPVAQLNILRFGDPTESETRELLNNVIKSLGKYSNNFGVPVVGGEILFDDSYSSNPLLNLMAVGLVKKKSIITSSFKKAGDRIILIGSGTSGSGVHGAGFASAPFTGKMKHLIPESQLADPYAGKVLSECILEMNEAGIIQSMQDVGAGGVLCAAAEMAHRGSKGADLTIENFPLVRKDLEAIDILLSQSQEQMLITVDRIKVGLFEKMADKWEVSYAIVGKVTDNGRIRIFHFDECPGDLPVSTLVRGGGAPVYIRNMKDPGRKVIKVSADEVPFPGSLKELAQQLIRSPNVASRKFIYEQFDTMAGLSYHGTGFHSDAGVLRIPGSRKHIAVSVDGNSRYVRREPRKGTMIAAAESARNIICSGGSPVALANGLNFGDPSDLHVYHDFVECIKGIRQIAEKMKVPVTAGNVSFNNLTLTENATLSIQPTPVIGMLGIIEDESDIMTVGFKSKGDMIFLIGRSDNDISGSEYLAAIHLIDETAAPVFDPDHEISLHRTVMELIRRRLIVSAHDVSLGGLFVALVESCLPNNFGFDITSPAEVREDAFLFGESQSRIIVSVSPIQETAFLDFMIEQDFPFSALGHVTKQELRIDDNSLGFITDYARDFENALGEILDS